MWHSMPQLALNLETMFSNHAQGSQEGPEAERGRNMFLLPKQPEATSLCAQGHRCGFPGAKITLQACLARDSVFPLAAQLPTPACLAAPQETGQTSFY